MITGVRFCESQPQNPEFRINPEKFPTETAHAICVFFGLRPYKKISVFRETHLKILGRVGIHIIFIIIFFLKKKKKICILKGILPFKMHKLYFFQKT